MSTYQRYIRDITALGSLTTLLLVGAVLLVLAPLKYTFNYIAGVGLVHIVVLIIRALYFKERPKKQKHSSFLSKLDASSFPSLHAARVSFVGAQAILYLNNSWFTVIMVIVVLLICYSRIYLKKHDKMDLTAGIIVGTIIAYIITFFF